MDYYEKKDKKRWEDFRLTIKYLFYIAIAISSISIIWNSILFFIILIKNG